MPWNMRDYPQSMKNLPTLQRKKAIDIANALLADGYPDERAIPIAMSQAEKWYKDASSSERKDFKKEPNPSKSDEHDSDANPELLDADVEVKHTDKAWIVRSVGSQRAAGRFHTKRDAIARGRRIVSNKGSRLSIYRKDGNHERTLEP